MTIAQGRMLQKSQIPWTHIDEGGVYGYRATAGEREVLLIRCQEQMEWLVFPLLNGCICKQAEQPRGRGYGAAKAYAEQFLRGELTLDAMPQHIDLSAKALAPYLPCHRRAAEDRESV